jgi:hypothetical protein
MWAATRCALSVTSPFSLPNGVGAWCSLIIIASQLKAHSDSLRVSEDRAVTNGTRLERSTLIESAGRCSGLTDPHAYRYQMAGRRWRPLSCGTALKRSGPLQLNSYRAPKKPSALATNKFENQMPDRRFPSPWSSEEPPACFVLRDGSGATIAYVYCEEAAVKLLSKDEARRIATNFARLPELLKSQPHWR